MGNAAAQAPVPPSKTEAIPTLEKRLKGYELESAKLASMAENLGKELNGTKDKLVEISKSVRENERTLNTLEARIGQLNEEKETLGQDLEKEKKSISGLILAMERMRRMPPEALIARPDTPIKTAQTAMLISDIVPALNKRAAKLKDKLKAMQRVQDDLETQKERALLTTQNLKEEQNKLTALLEKRQKIYAQTRTDLQEQEKYVRLVSLQSRNLQDLVTNLEERPGHSAPENSVRPTLPRSGDAQLPISGIVRVSFNQPDNFGAPSQGLTIEGRIGGLIVAPMAGIVRFAGPFKNYGNMVIIEHESNYHSLVAGLDKIDINVGVKVAAGEPLGSLGRGLRGQKPTLYYELRHKGKSINPAIKFTDLS